MKGLIILLALGIACWYGWKHYDEVLHPRPQHLAVVRNESGLKVIHLRLTVGHRTFVKEELPTGESATFPFIVDNDSAFELLWEYGGVISEYHWSGGLVAKGPLVERHTLTIREGGGVIVESQNR